jgi:hypothetical protein
MEGSMVDNMQNAPPDRNLSSPSLPHTTELSRSQGKEDGPGLNTNLVHQAGEVSSRCCLGRKLCVSISRGRPATDDLTYPIMLCTGHVCR